MVYNGKINLIWFELKFYSIRLSNCSDNVKTAIQETNWDSCPIQAELMSMKQTLRNSQYSIEGHRIFSSPPTISMMQLASFSPLGLDAPGPLSLCFPPLSSLSLDIGPLSLLGVLEERLSSHSESGQSPAQPTNIILHHCDCSDE